MGDKEREQCDTESRAINLPLIRHFVVKHMNDFVAVRAIWFVLGSFSAIFCSSCWLIRTAIGHRIVTFWSVVRIDEYGQGHCTNSFDRMQFAWMDECEWHLRDNFICREFKLITQLDFKQIELKPKPQQNNLIVELLTIARFSAPFARFAEQETNKVD